MADIPRWITSLLGEQAFSRTGYEQNADRVRSDFTSKLRRTVRRIPFATDLLAAYYCALDPQTPVRVRATLLAALAYFVLPLDGIPDFLIGVGFGDDASVLLAAITLVSAHVKDRHRVAAQAALDDDGDLRDDFKGPDEDTWTESPIIDADYEIVDPAADDPGDGPKPSA